MHKMLFQNKCGQIAFVLFSTILLSSSCKNKGYDSPDGYNLNKPQRIFLGKALTEVSGICFIQQDSSLLAISDSKERVFKLDLRAGKLKDYTPKLVQTDADLEDIVKVDSSLFLLMSRGVLKEVPDKATDSSSVKTYDLALPGDNEFETVYYDHSINSLVLLCKRCAADKGTNARTAYRFNLAKKMFDSSAFFSVSREDVKTLVKNSEAKFNPSAAAIHPINKRLYILSSAGHLLVVADKHGEVIEAYHLNPDNFPQAEGIAFAPNGNMYITNEGKYGKPTLLFFPYEGNEKKK